MVGGGGTEWHEHLFLKQNFSIRMENGVSGNEARKQRIKGEAVMVLMV